MAKRDVHIVPQKNQGGQTKSSHRTQATAIDKGTEIARRDKVDVVTHGRDGVIRSEDSYGNETKKRDMEH